DVGQRREGHVAAEHGLVPGPGGLAARPGQGRCAHQPPHPLLLGAGEAGRAQAGDPGRPAAAIRPKLEMAWAALGPPRPRTRLASQSTATTAMDATTHRKLRLHLYWK